MSTTVEQSFSRQFEAEVHLAYQRMGSKLRNTVRTKDGIKGSSTTFQKVGKGTASTKARHGKVPVMNIDHVPVEISLQDYYAGDWVDALDEIKLRHDERSVVANAGAYALGRKTDELLIAAMETTPASQDSEDGTTGLTKSKVLEAFARCGGSSRGAERGSGARSSENSQRHLPDPAQMAHCRRSTFRFIKNI